MFWLELVAAFRLHFDPYSRRRIRRDQLRAHDTGNGRVSANFERSGATKRADLPASGGRSQGRRAWLDTKILPPLALTQKGIAIYAGDRAGAILHHSGAVQKKAVTHHQRIHVPGSESIVRGRTPSKNAVVEARVLHADAHAYRVGVTVLSEDTVVKVCVALIVAAPDRPVEDTVSDLGPGDRHCVIIDDNVVSDVENDLRWRGWEQACLQKIGGPSYYTSPNKAAPDNTIARGDLDTRDYQSFDNRAVGRSAVDLGYGASNG